MLAPSEGDRPSPSRYPPAFELVVNHPERPLGMVLTWSEE